jgi:hypothetical protein
MLNINVYSTKRFGLEIYVVTINGVAVHEYLSKQLAMTKFVQLRQRLNK